MRAFRIVLAGHAPLPGALLATAETIAGSIADITAVGLRPHETPDHYASELRAAIGHDHRRVLVLADLLGGTPYNVAAAIARRSSRVVVLSGLNLALVLEAALASEPLDDALVDRLIESAREGIVETARHQVSRVS